MRVLVCGSRSFVRAQAVWDVLRGLHTGGHHHDEAFTVITGGASGADEHARSWAAAQIGGCPVRQEMYPADWSKHGKAAGPIRNQQMLEEGKPDLVVAFVDKPLAESRGTADMVRRARAARVETHVIETTPPEDWGREQRGGPHGE